MRNGREEFIIRDRDTETTTATETETETKTKTDRQTVDRQMTVQALSSVLSAVGLPSCVHTRRHDTCDTRGRAGLVRTTGDRLRRAAPGPRVDMRSCDEK